MLPPGPLAVMPALPRRPARPAAAVAVAGRRRGTGPRGSGGAAPSGRAAGRGRRPRPGRGRTGGPRSTLMRTVRPSATACSPRAMRAAVRAASPSSTSTARTPVRSVNVTERRGAQQPAGIDGDEEVAHPLDLAEQVAGDDDGDPELGPGPPDEREHLVAAGRIEAVGRLVEQQQARVVDERLGQLDPLLHPGRVAADGAVALLVQPDVTEDLGGPFARGRARQAGHPGHVGHEVGRGDVRRQAVVFGHVADELADRRALGPDVEVHHRRLARGRLEQPEEDLDERALAGAVGADQADDPRFEVQGQTVERDDARRIALGQVAKGDEAHALAKRTRRTDPRVSRSARPRSAEPQALDDTVAAGRIASRSSPSTGSMAMTTGPDLASMT